MYEFSRRAFLKALGKVTASLGMLFSLGAGCAKEENEVETVKTTPAEAPRRRPGFPKQRETAEVKQVSGPINVGKKKIIALCCGS